MPTGIPKWIEIPKSLKVEYVKGDAFVKLRDAAKLAGIPPVVLEMGQRLLRSGNTEGATFVLGTPDLKAKADDIMRVFKAGLRKVAKAFGTGGLAPRTYCDGEKIVCWYQDGGPGIKKTK